uniref:4Fe-4S ferredoxin-type domain-containing protein n=1 Tax=Leersia perrieri TaxID=77586 RepID=A0A0D9XX38_9ORYZ
MEELKILLVLMIAVAIFAGEAAADGGAQPAPDTNVLCVSKCGTCPTVCSSPPPPDSSSSGYNNPVLSPPKGSSGGDGGSSSSPSAPLAKGGRPGGGSNYYYFFTSGGSCVAATAYKAAVLVSFLSLVAVLSP